MAAPAVTTPVADVMTRAPFTVTAATTVEHLLELFDRHDFDAFPVVDDRGVLCGIVTKLDVLRLLRPDARLRVPAFSVLLGLQVDSIMRHGAVTVEATDPLVVAADLMVETRLHSLPVVRRGPGPPELVGIVSRGDLLRGLRFQFVESAAARAPDPG